MKEVKRRKITKPRQEPPEFAVATKTEISRINVEVNSLSKIATFLEGYKAGKGGNIQPLGNYDLEQLWNAIQFLRGNDQYECKDMDNGKG